MPRANKTRVGITEGFSLCSSIYPHSKRSPGWQSNQTFSGFWSWVGWAKLKKKSKGNKEYCTSMSWSICFCQGSVKDVSSNWRTILEGTDGQPRGNKVQLKLLTVCLICDAHVPLSHFSPWNSSTRVVSHSGHSPNPTDFPTFAKQLCLHVALGFGFEWILTPPWRSPGCDPNNTTHLEKREIPQKDWTNKYTSPV